MKKLPPKQQQAFDLLAENGPCTINMMLRLLRKLGQPSSPSTLHHRFAKLHKLGLLTRWPPSTTRLVVYAIKGSVLPEGFDRTTSPRRSEKWANQFNRFRGYSPAKKD